MGKYIKYFDNEIDLATFINFGDHSAPNGTGPETWVAYRMYEDNPRYSTGDNSDLVVNAQFFTAAYDAEYAELNIYPSVFNAKVYDMDGNLIGEAYSYNTTQMFYYIGVNDGPFQKTFSATVKYFDWFGGLVNESVISGTQEADPNVEPIYAIARLTIVSDGANPSRIGHWQLTNVATGFTYQQDGSEVDMSNDVYQDDNSMMYQFPSAGTYEVNIKYGLDANGKLAFVPNLQNTDANKVYFYTNYPQYAEQVDFSIGGFLADSSAVTEVVLGEGVQKFTGMPWMNLTNLTTFRMLDTNKLPEFQDWMMSWGVPTGVTAYADENAEGYDAWTAATANYNWTWINPFAIPLTFEITSPGYINWIDINSDLVIEYSKNGGEWTEVTASTQIPVVSGDTVQFRGDNESYRVGDTTCGFSNSTCGFKLKGNIMSLVQSTGFSSRKDLVADRTFESIFSNIYGLTDASELLLPATGLTQYCYSGMFQGCEQLEKAPELPVGTLQPYCYYALFFGCTALNYIKCLATDISAEGCTNDWVYGVGGGGGSSSSSSGGGSDSESPTPGVSGTFVKAASMNDWIFDNSGIPNGWTVVNA